MILELFLLIVVSFFVVFRQEMFVFGLLAEKTDHRVGITLVLIFDISVVFLLFFANLDIVSERWVITYKWML